MTPGEEAGHFALVGTNHTAWVPGPQESKALAEQWAERFPIRQVVGYTISGIWYKNECNSHRLQTWEAVRFDLGRRS